MRTLATLLWVIVALDVICGGIYLLMGPAMSALTSSAATRGEGVEPQLVTFYWAQGLFYGCAFIAFAVLNGLAARAIHQGRNYVLILVTCAVDLVFFPVGTGIGIYGLIQLTKREVQDAFNPRSAGGGPGARTYDYQPPQDPRFPPHH